MALDYSNKKVFNDEFPRRDMGENWHYYNDVIRPSIRNADLVFCSGSAWNSELIQWKSHSIWSHVGMIIRMEETDRVFILESVDKMGVRLIPLSKVLYDYEGNKKPYNGRVFIARHKEVTPLNAIEIITHGMEQLTNRYDNAEFIRILLRILLGKGKLENNKQYMCSELAHECFLEAGIQFKYEKGLFIAPGALAADKNIQLLHQMI